MLLDVLLDAVLDCLKELPFLFAAFFVVEAIAHRAASGMSAMLARAGCMGPLIGALLGCVPQCGFSVMASELYVSGVVTLGTLLSVYLSTSDEAVIILLANPGHLKEIVLLLVTKVCIAVLFGYLTYFFGAKLTGIKHRSSGRGHSHGDACACGGQEDLHTGGWKDIFRHALSHTLEVLLFLFLTTFILNLLMELAGRELIGRLLLQNSLLQPAVAALIGLIPNCAASVILTELYLDGVISFGAAVSGLSAGAGLGLLVLWRVHPDRQEALRITELLYLTAVVSGTVLMLVLPF